MTAIGFVGLGAMGGRMADRPVVGGLVRRDSPLEVAGPNEVAA
jgi:3-hydroxyisobutyrate dehydrogenase-like beta-hydroxyacid dehydrogenase